ncbi:MAG: twin-arginine translocase subunit TatC [Candidatus Omnitrophica bacterium]|nr:twin-arginine translocase subunit TatC [Candidatus Omnitrophota bacterium]
MTSDARRPLLEHLEELRRRLWTCFVWLLAAGTFVWLKRDEVMNWLLVPVGQVSFTTLTEPFMAQLKLAFLGGLILASPVLLWQAWEFIAIALTPRERQAVGRLLPFSILLFVAGAWLALTQWVPVSVRFFLGFAGPNMIPMISIGRYLGFVGSLAFACGFLAQTPLVIAALARLGIVTPGFLIYHWKGAVLGSFVMAAIATPTPDIFTQSLLAGFLLGLYVLSMGLAWFARPRRWVSDTELGV